MEIFLIISAGVFFIFGALFMLSPKAVEAISSMTNKVLFTLDDKFPLLRRPLGILFLAVTVYLWYVVLYKMYR